MEHTLTTDWLLHLFLLQALKETMFSVYDNALQCYEPLLLYCLSSVIRQKGFPGTLRRACSIFFIPFFTECNFKTSQSRSILISVIYPSVFYASLTLKQTVSCKNKTGKIFKLWHSLTVPLSKDSHAVIDISINFTNLNSKSFSSF